MGRLTRPFTRPERPNTSDRPLSQVRLKIQVRFRARKIIGGAVQGDNGGQVRRGVPSQALRTHSPST